MTHKKTFFSATILPSLLLVSAFVPTMVSAKMMTTEARPPIRVGTISASPSVRMEDRIENRTDKKMDLAGSSADREIDRRVTALSNLASRITDMKRITTDQKSTLLTQVQTAISDLKTLKTKIDADTDPATLKTDKQSIVSSYRVFLLLIPKIEVVAHADKALELADQMAANNTTIKAKIDAAQTAGKDVTSLTALLTDRTAKITDAQTKALAVISSVLPLTPDNYPANKPTLVAGRDSLKTVRQDLNTAYQDLVKINEALK